MAVTALQTFLAGKLNPRLQERIAEHWRATGPPQDVMDRILAVQQTPGEWRALLLPDEPDHRSNGGFR